MIERATAELAELAAAVRPDWDRNAVSSALTVASVSGMPWARMLTEMARLMTQEAGSPRDLLDLAADARTAYVHDPQAYADGLAAAREAIRRPA